jgi:hypothetical protein
VREDPDRAGLLYAGTEFGMFISFDNGAYWQPFQLNLPNVPVTDIKVHRRDLIVSTQGRAIWILDNVSSLHQLASHARPSETILFKPRDGYRTRVGPTNLGPVVDYYLPSAPTEAVVIEILDSKGAVLNSYTSEAPALRPGRGNTGANMPGVGGAGPESQPDPDAAPVRRAAPPPRVTKAAGMNRFAWDMRNQAGVTLPPGQYQVRLKSGAVALTQSLNLLIDPRVAADGVTLADLQEQFEHNMRMRALVTEVNQLVSRVREAQNKKRDNSNPNGASPALDAISSKLITEPVRYGKPGLQAHITYLAGMTANVDQKIGRDAIQRYEVLKKELEAVRAEVDRLLGPALRSQL